MRFFLLGPLRVKNNGSPIDIGGNKQQVLLTALVLAKGNVVSTDRLIDLIWGADPPSKPYAAIRSYISHLRRQLQPESRPGDRSGLLVTQSPGYSLQVESDEVDAFRFEALVSRASDLLASGDHTAGLAVVEQARSLWRSVDLADSPLAMFFGESERLLELKRQAEALRFDALLADGRHKEIVADLRSMVDADPTQERPLSQLMIALYRSGRPAEALQAYQAGFKATIEQTGLEPSPDLTTLEQQILHNDPALRGREQSRPGQESGGSAATQRSSREWNANAGRPIGRDAEITRLTQVLDQPEGQFVVLSGEPGIGKSELMRYAAASAHDRGFTVAWGIGHRSARSAALAPWRAIVTDLAERLDRDALAELVGERGPELAMLAPAISTRLGVAEAEARDAATLKEGIARFLIGAAEQRPLLICLDDLHWMDDSSLALLSYLASTNENRRVVIIASRRDTEVLSEEQTLALAELGRLAEGNRLDLAGLEVGAVGQLWESLGRWTDGEEPADEHVAALQERTNGNPLFVKELIRSSDRPDRLTPSATINDVISARLASVPDQARRLLNIGSLCPEGFTEQLLAELGPQDEEELLDQLELLMAAKLIEEDPQRADRFSFTHSLIGESLAAQMSGVRRARLHTRIAEVLQKEQATIDQLAHHLLSGASSGDPIAAAQSALTAAGEAARLHDHSSAIDLIERGLAALERTDDDQLRAQLMIELAQERKHRQHFTQSHAAAQEGFRLAKRAGDVDLMALAALSFCGQGKKDNRFGISWLGYWNPPGPALDMLGQCLEKLESGPQRVIVLIAYASQLFGEYDNPAEARIILDEAIAESRTSPHRELLAAALNQELFTLQRHMSYRQRKANVEESLTIADEMGTPERIVAANRALTILRLEEDDLAGAKETITVSRAELANRDEPALALFVESMRIAMDLYQGRFTEAEAGINAAMARYEHIGSAALDILGIQYASLLRDQGRLEELENLLRWRVSGYPGPAYGVALAMVLAEQGKSEEAVMTLTDYGGERIETGGEGVLQFTTPALYAETIAAIGDVDRAAMLYPAMAGAANRVVAMYSGIFLLGSGSLYLGRLATVLGRFDEAAAHLNDAERHHRLVEAKPFLLRTLLAKMDLAEAVGESRNGETAADPEVGAGAVAEEARALARSIGMDWLLGQR